MKKIVATLVMIIITIAVMTSCAFFEQKPTHCTVTFRQTGCTDVVFTVEYGEDFDMAQIPAPQAKDGFLISWDLVDLTNITEDIVILATETVVPGKFTITFKQEGYEDIVKVVDEGQSLAQDQIPTVKTEKGYTIVWEEVDLTNVKANLVVNAIKSANQYTIKLVYNANNLGLDLSGLPTEITVTYGQSIPALPQFSSGDNCGYSIEYWKLEGNKFDKTTYDIADNITLTAKWQYYI